VELPAFLTRDADGEIRLTGHRIGLYTVVRRLQAGQSPEAIAAELPSLSPDLVRRVIDFARANGPEVEAYVAEYRADLQQQEALPPGPGTRRARRLAEALEQADRLHAGEPEWFSLPVQEKLRRLACVFSGNSTS
jgi:uncharacterized protein (DUF433 family)